MIQSRAVALCAVVSVAATLKYRDTFDFGLTVSEIIHTISTLIGFVWVECIAESFAFHIEASAREDERKKNADAAKRVFDKAFSDLVKTSLKKPNAPSREQLSTSLADLRASKRFRNSWNPEYDVLCVACSEPQDTLDRDLLREKCVLRGMPPTAVEEGDTPLTLSVLAMNLTTKMRKCYEGRLAAGEFWSMEKPSFKC